MPQLAYRLTSLEILQVCDWRQALYNIEQQEALREQHKRMIMMIQARQLAELEGGTGDESSIVEA